MITYCSIFHDIICVCIYIYIYMYIGTSKNIKIHHIILHHIILHYITLLYILRSALARRDHEVRLAQVGDRDLGPAEAILSVLSLLILVVVAVVVVVAAAVVVVVVEVGNVYYIYDIQ